MSELDKTPLRDEDFVDLRFQDALLFIKCLRLKGVVEGLKEKISNNFHHIFKIDSRINNCIDEFFEVLK